MNFLNKLGDLFSRTGAKSLVGKDKKGNQFFTIPHAKAGMYDNHDFLLLISIEYQILIPLFS